MRNGRDLNKVMLIGRIAEIRTLETTTEIDVSTACRADKESYCHRCVLDHPDLRAAAAELKAGRLVYVEGHLAGTAVRVRDLYFIREGNRLN